MRQPVCSGVVRTPYRIDIVPTAPSPIVPSAPAQCTPTSMPDDSRTAVHIAVSAARFATPACRRPRESLERRTEPPVVAEPRSKRGEAPRTETRRGRTCRQPWHDDPGDGEGDGHQPRHHRSSSPRDPEFAHCPYYDEPFAPDPCRAARTRHRRRYPAYRVPSSDRVLELDRDQNIGRGHDREEEVRHGHGGRARERRRTSRHRADDGRRGREAAWRTAAPLRLSPEGPPRLAQTKEVEVVITNVVTEDEHQAEGESAVPAGRGRPDAGPPRRCHRAAAIARTARGAPGCWPARTCSLRRRQG